METVRPSFSTLQRALIFVCCISLALFSVLSLTLNATTPSEELGARTRILCFGDSLTAGWYKNRTNNESTPKVRYAPYSMSLQQALGSSGVRAIPLGFPGWTSENLLSAAYFNISGEGESRRKPGLVVAIKRYRPTLVVIMVGTNDIFRNNDVDGGAIAGRVWKLHQLSHRASVRTMALGIPKWSRTSIYRTVWPVTDDQRFKSRADLNAALQRLTEKDREWAQYVEFPIPFSLDSPQWDADGLHLSPTGYAELGLKLATQIKPFVIHR